MKNKKIDEQTVRRESVDCSQTSELVLTWDSGVILPLSKSPSCGKKNLTKLPNSSKTASKTSKQFEVSWEVSPGFLFPFHSHSNLELECEFSSLAWRALNSRTHLPSSRTKPPVGAFSLVIVFHFVKPEASEHIWRTEWDIEGKKERSGTLSC